MRATPSLFSFHVPAWLTAWSSGVRGPFADDAAAMAVAIEAATRNVRERTGGPFGALVVGADGMALAVGVNLVVASKSSVLHAEIVAILLAQRVVRSHDLGRCDARGVALYASAEPCAMCMGAIPWSGVRRVVVGARDEDVRAIGFDEGDKPSDWVTAYARRGIAVTRDILRDDACSVLREYAAKGGALY